MKKRKSRGGSSVAYKQDNDYTINNDWDSDININRFDDSTFDITITVNNKKQTLKGTYFQRNQNGSLMRKLKITKKKC